MSNICTVIPSSAQACSNQQSNAYLESISLESIAHKFGSLVPECCPCINLQSVKTVVHICNIFVEKIFQTNENSQKERPSNKILCCMVWESRKGSSMGRYTLYVPPKRTVGLFQMFVHSSMKECSSTRSQALATPHQKIKTEGESLVWICM